MHLLNPYSTTVVFVIVYCGYKKSRSTCSVTHNRSNIVLRYYVIPLLLITFAVNRHASEMKGSKVESYSLLLIENLIGSVQGVVKDLRGYIKQDITLIVETRKIIN